MNVKPEVIFMYDRLGTNSPGSQTALESRIACATGCPEPPAHLIERHLGNLNGCKDFLIRRTEKYVKKSLEIFTRRLENRESHPHDLAELAPLQYPWWLVFVTGPFQRQENSFPEHCLPQKSIQSGWAFFWCFLWRNPAPVDWLSGFPSAAELMKGKSYHLCVETLNFSQVSKGPEIELNSTFSTDNCLEAKLLAFNFLPPAQRRREIYHMSVTIEMTEAELPLIAFASSINDLSSEPVFLFEPENSTRPLFQETPLNFLVY